MTDYLFNVVSKSLNVIVEINCCNARHDRFLENIDRVSLFANTCFDDCNVDSF